MANAVREIRKVDGLVADPISKAKSLRKFGRKDDLATTAALIANIPGDPSFLTTDAITSVVSDDASDTSAFLVEGHTIDGSGNLTFVVQTGTLTGQTPVVLDTPLARASRFVNISATEYVGTISVYEGGAAPGGVVTDDNEVHVSLPAGLQQSFKAQTSVSHEDYFIVTCVAASVLRQQSRNVDFTFETRSTTGVWLPKFQFGAASTGSSFVQVDLEPVVIVPPNTDVRITGSASSTATAVTAFFAGYLLSKTGTS